MLKPLVVLEIWLLAVRLLKELSHGLGRDQDLIPVVIPNSSPKDDLLVSHDPRALAASTVGKHVPLALAWRSTAKPGVFVRIYQHWTVIDGSTSTMFRTRAWYPQVLVRRSWPSGCA